VKTQVWIAVCTYLLVAIIRKRLGLNLSLYTILQVLSLSLFEKTPLNRTFEEAETQIAEYALPKQLDLLHF
jgi:hypothetical protein